MNTGPAQTEQTSESTAEIERIYVAPELKGKGLGKMMIQHAIKKAAHLEYLWVGVWERNKAAIGFYKKLGFKVHGTHIFQLGNDPQQDLILKLDL